MLVISIVCLLFPLYNSASNTFNEIILRNRSKQIIHFFGTQSISASQSASIKVNNDEKETGKIELEVQNTDYILEYPRALPWLEATVTLDIPTLIYMYQAKPYMTCTYKTVKLYNDSNTQIVLNGTNTLAQRSQYTLSNNIPNKFQWYTFIYKDQLCSIPYKKYKQEQDGEDVTLFLKTIILLNYGFKIYPKSSALTCLLQ